MSAQAQQKERDISDEQAKVVNGTAKFPAGETVYNAENEMVRRNRLIREAVEALEKGEILPGCETCGYGATDGGRSTALAKLHEAGY